MRISIFIISAGLLIALCSGACSKVIRGYVQPRERSNMPVDPAVDTLVKSFHDRKSGRTKFQVYSVNNKKVLVRQFSYMKDSTYWVSTARGFFNKDEGFRYRYYPNGALAAVVPLVDGKAEGTARYFFKDGSLSGERLFRQDQQDSTTRLFWENGREVGTFEYDKGRLMRVHNYFDPAGKPLNMGSFENGNGELWLYDDKGAEVEQINTYKAGKLINTRRADGGKVPPGLCRC